MACGLAADHFAWTLTMVWASYQSENKSKLMNVQLPRESQAPCEGYATNIEIDFTFKVLGYNNKCLLF